MTKKERIEKIVSLLKKEYPEVITPLLHQSAWQLVTATMLSAQTLDTTVNTVTPTLFKKYKSIKELAAANPSDVDEIIRVVNYHKTKSNNVVLMANKLLKDFNGVVPHTIETLTQLPGVGRKTANVVISEWFAKPIDQRGNPTLLELINVPENEKVKVLPEGFVVDTHVLRTSFRLGLTKNKTPEKVEQDLMKIFPQDEWNDMSLRLIFHGRFRCKARNNMCCEHPEWSQLCIC